MRKIKLADGSEYPVEYCGASGGLVSFSLEEKMSIRECAEIFSDKTKTVKIDSYQDDILLESHEGYTHLICLIEDRFSHKIDVQIVKEEG